VYRGQENVGAIVLSCNAEVTSFLTATHRIIQMFDSVFL